MPTPGAAPHVGVIVGSLDGQALEVDDAFCDIIGYSREDILGGVVTWQSVTPPEYHARVLSALERAARGDIPEPFEQEYLRKDGTRFPLIVGGGPLPGTPPRVVVFIVDMSARTASRSGRTRGCSGVAGGN